MVTVELWELYEKDINAYHEMSLSEKLNIKRNPGADFIFLVQMGGSTTDQRLALLKGMQENGGVLSDETYEAVFGRTDKHGFDMARIQITYNASIDGTTFVELEKEVSRKAAEKRMQFAGMFLLSLTISGSNEAQNPAPYDGNLDPNYRLDQIELNSKNGFKNYDYVPLPQTTLDWLKENYPMPGDAKFMGPMVDKGVSEAVEGAGNANPNNVKVSQGQQDKHIPGTNNYKQSIESGVNRSILNENPQQLLDGYAGTGTSMGANKEWVDFGKVIGEYYDVNTGTYVDTTKGIIHYNSSGGAHIVPSNPTGIR